MDDVAGHALVWCEVFVGLSMSCRQQNNEHRSNSVAECCALMERHTILLLIKNTKLGPVLSLTKITTKSRRLWTVSEGERQPPLTLTSNALCCGMP